MKYETAKNLNNTRFKRLVGVAKPTFDEMVEILKSEYQAKPSMPKVAESLSFQSKTCSWLLCSILKNTAPMNR